LIKYWYFKIVFGILQRKRVYTMIPGSGKEFISQIKKKYAILMLYIPSRF